MNAQPEKKSLVFKNFAKLKLGLSTSNFLKAMPFTVTSLSELIDYASNEGYQYIEVRDFNADLTINDCKVLAAASKKYMIGMIYVFNKNPLDSGFFEVFERALANVLIFPGPGILRALVSKSEFEADPLKKGWNKEEFAQLLRLTDRCAVIAKANNIQFVVENNNETFFGEVPTYFGLADFFEKSSGTGLQLDIANLFCNTSRVRNDPDKVFSFLSRLENRWIETHLKTVKNGEPQSVLTDNPLKIEKIIELMGRMDVLFVTLELAAIADKQQCFDNHALSIQFLKDKGVLKN